MQSKHLDNLSDEWTVTVVGIVNTIQHLPKGRPQSAPWGVRHACVAFLLFSAKQKETVTSSIVNCSHTVSLSKVVTDKDCKETKET